MYQAIIIVFILLLVYLATRKKELFCASCAKYKFGPDWWFVTGYPTGDASGIAQNIYHDWAKKPDVYYNGALNSTINSVANSV